MSFGQIPFNIPPVVGLEADFVSKAVQSRELIGDGVYSKLCQKWFEDKTGSFKSLITPSCTAALEMTAMLIDIKPGDEVIMPSYTFVSTANAFALRGAKIVFVDIRPDSMNIDEELIECAITDKTKAIVVVHYAGVACEIDKIMKLADFHGLYVIEDAAQGMMSEFRGKALGTIGHFGTYSFHGTKNYTSAGEGGLLLINDESFVERAEIIREKGTNRSNFLRGQVDKYSWVDIGSSYLPSELQSAYLWGQLQMAEDIYSDRLESWGCYLRNLQLLEDKKHIELPTIPEFCKHNAHMFYIKVENTEIRSQLLNFLQSHNVQAAFHYVPLHSSAAGERYGRFHGEDVYTTAESERLVRLPLWYGITEEMQGRVTSLVNIFFESSRV